MASWDLMYVMAFFGCLEILGGLMGSYVCNGILWLLCIREGAQKATKFQGRDG